MSFRDAEKTTPDGWPCTIRLRVDPEASTVRGNALASGDDAADRAFENEILAQLQAGNDWAWCCVIVTATHAPSGPVGRDILGRCSYANEDDFVAGEYFPVMVELAMADLDLAITRAREALRKPPRRRDRKEKAHGQAK